MTSLTLANAWLLDAQTTGASPQHGHLLELAWALTAPDQPALTRQQHHLIALPPGAALPAPITALTGIHPRDLLPAPTLASVTDALASDLDDLPAPLVIHYARFERPFLDDAFARQHRALPHDPICTHEIARRLFPDLPRRGLRALAGLLGHHLPDLKRAHQNVAATALVWAALTHTLADQEDVHTLPELRAWLDSTTPRKRARFDWPLPRERRLALPDHPGVYQLRDRNGATLYVGKAASLKQRVNSYFQKRHGHTERALELLTRATDLHTTPTHTALEAALLEADEIKRLAPPYNLALQRADRRTAAFNLHLHTAPAPDPQHPLAPLPHPLALQPLAAIAALLRPDAPCAPPLTHHALAIPPRWAPDDAIFLKGFQLFREKHADACDDPERVPALLALGASSWPAWRAAQAARVADPDPDDLDGAPAPREWTPEAVTAALEWQLIAAARALRRACWMGRLCDGALWWTPHRQHGAPRLLRWRAGLPAPSSPCPAPPDAPPLPPPRPWLERLRDLDIDGYDRLSVLTAELRRVCAEGHPLRLWLADGLAIDARDLRALLYWL
jgi:DNA polymerase-3 subunit epsilon